MFSFEIGNVISRNGFMKTKFIRFANNLATKHNPLVIILLDFHINELENKPETCDYIFEIMMINWLT